MAKIQKIWLAVCGAMFLIPEILWGLIQRTINQLINDLFNFEIVGKFYLLDNIPNINLIRVFLLCQLLGILGLMVLAIKNKKTGLMFVSLFFIFIIVFGLAASFLFTFSSIG